LLQKHEPYIRQCYELAARAVAHGNHPFGALLVTNGEVIFTAENTVLTEQDPTGHAETNLVRAACRALGPDVVASSTLYTSTEPCPMCSGAIAWATIRHMVYGCGADTLYAITGGIVKLRSRDVFNGMGMDVLVEGPVLEVLGIEQHRNYWETP
jgi:tRNA(Arg) A34 adenosine deaminase TadA